MRNLIRVSLNEDTRHGQRQTKTKTFSEHPTILTMAKTKTFSEHPTILTMAKTNSKAMTKTMKIASSKSNPCVK